MLLNYLQKEYALNEPIFISDLSFPDINYTNLRQSIKRLVDKGLLCRFDTGVYYLPKPSSVFKFAYPDIDKIIERKYIKRNGKMIGYYSGLMVANSAGITTQLAAEKTIITNLESSRGRTVIIRNRRIRLKCPKVAITENNVKTLQMLDLITDAEKYSESNTVDTYDILVKYIKNVNISKKDVNQCLPSYPGRTAKILLETGLYDALA